MARPTKQGVDYFPLDVNLDSKFKFIEMNFGLEGFAIIIKIFQEIYANGYWAKFGQDELLLFSFEVNVDINRVNAVISEAIVRNIFDKELYDKYEILTSLGIQKRYKEIVKRRKDVEVIQEYLLISGDFGVNANIKSINVCNNSINVDNMQASCKQNVYKSTQSKVKERKVKESKVKESKVNNVDTKVSMSVSTAPEPTSTIDYDSILEYWNRVSMLPELRSVTPKRKTHLNARIKEHGLEAIYKAIDNCANSKFMRGENGRNWVASFDWVFGSPNNFIKTLEGNYLDKKISFNLKSQKMAPVPEWYGKYKNDLETVSKEKTISTEEQIKISKDIDKIL